MVQQSKSLINHFFYFCIKIYQLFFSRFTPHCIYKESCSDYALRIVIKEKSPYNNFRKIIKRIKGCKVKEIIKCNNASWYILNGYNERININNISRYTFSQIEKSIKN